MKKLNLIIGLACCLMLLVSGCKKDPTLLELIQDGKWILTAQTDDGVDVYKALKTCEKDDIYSFTVDNKYVIDEGATKCAASDPQSTTAGTYTISADEKVIAVKDANFGITLDFKVLEATETSLKLESNFAKVSIYTFKKQ